MFIDRLTAVLAVAAVIMFALPMAEGFASPTGYTSTTVCSDNSISAEYFTVGLYSRAGDVYAPATSDRILSNPINIDGSGNVVVGSNTLSPDNLYIRISGPSGSGYNYSLSTPVMYLMDNGSSISGTVYALTVGSATYSTSNGTWTGDTTLYADTWYNISFEVTFTTAHTIVSETFDGSVSIVVSGIVTGDSIHGTYAESHSCDFEIQSITNELEQLNDDNPYFEGYAISDEIQSGGYTYNGQSYDAVRIENEDNVHHGIADGGQVQVSIIIPSGKSFMIVLYDTTGNGRIHVTVTGDNTYHTPSSGIKLSATMYIAYSSGTTLSGYSSFGGANSSGNWIPAGTGNVTIEIHDSNGNINENCKMDIILN